MKKNEAYNVGITGHRHLGAETVRGFVKIALRESLASIQEAHGSVHALSALAIGADTLFAEIALELGCKLEVVVPFKRFEEDFTSADALQRYQSLIERAASVHKLRYRNRSNTAYFAGGRWIVNKSSLLIAVWNGKPGKGRGGTSDIVAYACKKRKQYWHIDTEELIIKEGKGHGQEEG